LPASVLFYSPPIDPEALPTPGAKPSPPMLDVAILKVNANNLPTIPLAADIRRVHLGQQIAVVGYPGVVVWHDFLSPTSRAEPTVTYGRISSFKTDINERRILQTDAAISWGNSGGPAFNTSGEAVGVATFISATLEGDQAIQGFNFLLPVDTIQQAAREASVIPTTESAFNSAWDGALAAYTQGQFRQALAQIEAADAVVPGLIEVEDMRERLEELLHERSSRPNAHADDGCGHETGKDRDH
jgi:serine protease Do